MQSLNFIRRHKKIFLTILTLTIPTIVDILVQTLIAFFDMVMIGKLGYDRITAVGLGNTPIIAIIPVFLALSIGTSVLISRFYGANQKTDAKNALIQSLILAIPISLVVMIFFYIFSDSILNAVSKSSDIDIKEAKDYFIMGILSLIFICFNSIFSAAFRAVSLTKIPMYIGIANIFTNIILNYIFIFILNMGVFGASFATTLSKMITTCIFFYLIFHRDDFWISLKWSDISFNPKLSKRILKISFPSAIEQLVLRFGMLTFEIMIISLGSLAYASHKISLTAESFSFSIGFSFSYTVAALVGQQLGKKSPIRAQVYALISTIMAITIMTVMGLLFFIFPNTIIRLFIDEPDIVALGSKALRLISLCQPFLAASMVLSGSLRGAGDSKTVLFITFIGIFLIRLPLTYICIHILKTGLVGPLIVMTIDLLLRSSLAYYLFKKGNWRHVGV